MPAGYLGPTCQSARVTKGRSSRLERWSCTSPHLAGLPPGPGPVKSPNTWMPHTDQPAVVLSLYRLSLLLLTASFKSSFLHASNTFDFLRSCLAECLPAAFLKHIIFHLLLFPLCVQSFTANPLFLWHHSLPPTCSLTTNRCSLPDLSGLPKWNAINLLGNV